MKDIFLIVAMTLGLVFNILAFWKGSSALEEAHSARRMSLATSDQYSAIVSSMTELDKEMDVLQVRSVTQEGPSKEWSKAWEESEQDRREVWKSLERLADRMKHLERMVHAMKEPPKEGPVDLDKQDFYQEKEP